jgi:hypothetical protein
MQVLPKYEREFFMYSRFKKCASVLLDEICKIKDTAWQSILFKHGGLQDEKTID